MIRPPPKSALFPYTTLFRSTVQWLGTLPSHSIPDGCMATAAFSPLVTAREITAQRSEEHTSELQSRENLVCRLLLEKKKIVKNNKSAALIRPPIKISAQPSR